jgi:hypothetical protein
MFIRALLTFSLISSFILGDEARPELRDGQFEMLVLNRVLAQANGTPITALDVFKRMDFLFYRQYPEYISSDSAKYQYYQMNWKEALNELIDRELMRADAVEMKIEINPSEVRQELEQTFGPDIILNLDKIGLSLDEAMTMLKDELLIRRVMMFKVNGRVYRTIGPLELKNAYEEWVKGHTTPEKWRYQVVTLRSTDEKEAIEAAEHIREALLEGKALEVVREECLQEELISPAITLTVSDPYLHPQEEVPPLILPHLTSLENGAVSEPFSQVSRRTGEVVVRLVLLDEKVAAYVPPLRDVEVRLKNQLLQKGMEEQSRKYLASLREHYHVSSDRNDDQNLPLRIIPKF